jgi:hypothetical protein
MRGSIADRVMGGSSTMRAADRIRRLRRFGASLAIILFPRGIGAVTTVGYIAGFALIGFAILVGVKFTQDLYRDSAEAYAWGRQFLWGYGRHPPLTGWIADLWYRVFPAADWASYLLSRMLVFVSLTSIYFLARRTLDPRRAALIVFAMSGCSPLRLPPCCIPTASGSSARLRLTSPPRFS